MKTLTRLITLCVIFQMSNLASAYDFEVDGIYYNILSLTDLTCEVTHGDTKYKGDVKIPEKIEYQSRDLTVIGIGDSAFEDCWSLTSVEFPNTTDIGDSAFEDCWSLTSVDFPNATYIGDSAFYMCYSLVSVDLPNATYIGDSAFYCCDLTSVDFPNVTSIGFSAFYSCDMTSVEFPNATYIGARAFEDCRSLTSVDLPNVTSIGFRAFEDCESLTSVDLPNVTSIGNNAFEDCSKLESITFPKLSSIEAGLFSECTSLKSLNIPGNLKRIVHFEDEVPIEDWWFNQTFINCSLKELKFEYGDAVLESVCNIIKKGEDRYFRIGFYSHIDDIKYYVNSYNTKITGTFLSVEKVYIDREINTFLEFNDLKELTLGEHITSIQVNIPSETLICLGSTPISVSDDYFSNSKYLNLTVKVPKDALDAYRNAPGWKNFWNLQAIDDSSEIDNIASDVDVKEIGRYDLNGRAVSEDYKGIVITRYSDGATRKMIVK